MKQTLKDITILSVLLSALFGFMLGSRPLSTPDEGRYVEIPREMAVSGDYVTPRLNGVKYFEKPALFYWAQAFMIKLFGIHEWAMRILPALFGLLGCLAVYWAGVQLWGRREGIFSAVILGTSVLYYAHTRIIILDLAVSVFISIALLSFLLATRAPPGRSQTLYLAFFFAACAGATLTKGLIGLAIPGMTILIWTALTKHWAVLKLAFNPWGILFFLTLAAPWHILASLRNPTFFYFYFIHEHFIRFLMDAHGRTQPFWFFIPIVLLGLFPWVCFLYQSIRKSLKEKDKTFSEEMYLLIWIGFTFVFFSIGKSKLIPYIVPIFPAIALLIGKYMAFVWDKRGGVSSFTQGTYGYSILCLILSIVPWIALYDRDLLGHQGLRPYAIFISCFMPICAAIVYGLRAFPRRQIVAIIVNSCVFMMTANGAWPMLDHRSIKPIALKIQEMGHTGDEIVCYHQYYQDLPPYLNQTVKVVGWDGELKHGMQWEDTSSWMMNDVAFWSLWNSEKRVFVVMRKEAFKDLSHHAHKNLYFVMEFGRDVLLVNKDPTGL